MGTVTFGSPSLILDRAYLFWFARLQKESFLINWCLLLLGVLEDWSRNCGLMTFKQEVLCISLAPNKVPLSHRLTPRELN